MTELKERLKSPVVWVSALTIVYTYVEMADFSSVRSVVLAVLGIMIAIFSGLNNPADRDNM